MPQQILEVQYRCLQSCQANCKEGEISIKSSAFESLSDEYEEENVFKSPGGVCLMGYPQRFEVVEDEVTEEDEDSGEDFDDPVETLREEHQQILDDLKVIEGHLMRRDLAALKTAILTLERDVVLHSLVKEEKGLFPHIQGMQLSAAPMPIMEEEHRETGLLINNFKEGLEDGDIRDGIADAIMANLRNHIRKEDEEFFTALEDRLTTPQRREITEEMDAVEQKALSGDL